MKENKYIPFASEILEVIKHTELEYTFRMSYSGEVKPGQFFEVSIPKYGEAPISVSGVGRESVDLTIRKVGKVTGEIFEQYVGRKLFLRGPYGNGFDVSNYQGKELVVVAGGTGLSPVRGVVDHDPLGCIEDPDNSVLGAWLAKAFELPLVTSVGYETPGSFGSWCADLGLPCITAEFPPISADEASERYLDAMMGLLHWQKS